MHSLYDQILNDAIAVSGVPRSGTSILMKLLASAEKTEIAYEPPLAETLDFLSQNGSLSNREIYSIWMTYVSEHYVLDAAMGRGVNLREGEYSSFLEYKSHAELSRRLETAGGALQTAAQVRRERPILTFKLVASWDLLSILLSKSPSLRAVEISRCPWQVTASIASIGWFEPELDSGVYLPMTTNSSGNSAPYRCSEKLSEDWPYLSNEQRSAKYVIELAEQRSAFLSGFESLVQINYEELVKSPQRIKNQLFDKFQLKDGQNTERILEAIVPTPNKSSEEAKVYLRDKLGSEVIAELDKLTSPTQAFYRD